MKLGLLDLDTSHSAAWLPILRKRGHEVVCVHDGGDVHPRGYADRFAADHGIARVCGSPEEMVELVDGVVIHSCNWDKHAPLARPFLAAGRVVLLDKPLAGNVADIDELRG